MSQEGRKPAVIILDGNQRSALAATRSLGARGIDVIIGSDGVRSLASASRYCTKFFSYHKPESDPQAFLRDVFEYSNRYAETVLFPMTDVTLNEILLNKCSIPENVRVPFSDHGRYDALTDKEKLFRLAMELSIPMPETLFSSDFTSRDSLLREAVKMGFPLVVKAVHSRARISGRYIASSAMYANDPEELRAVLERDPYYQSRCLVQKRIKGPGIGIFLLARNGDTLVRFAHRRIREKPPSGGVSVLSESIIPPNEALRAASELVSSVGWHGVAMIEFKWDEAENRAKLIEVNARFWGSLNLAIRAGVDFPYLLYRLALEKKVEAPAGYKIGLKSRWEFGDLDHLLICMKSRTDCSSLSGLHGRKMGMISDFIADFFRPSVIHEVFNAGDPRPFLLEAKEYIRSLVTRA